jgi:hypothetical protein
MIVYTLDEDHPIFGHQARIASEVAKKKPGSHFLSIYPAGQQKFTDKASGGFFQVTNVGWHEGSPILNLTKFWIIFLLTLIRIRPTIIFSHMVDTQAALIAPLLFVLRKTHILWYAHKTRSIPLIVCSIFCDLVLTSTRGSCPIKSSKVMPIGQSIDSKQFTPRNKVTKIENALHVGRLDESKRIEYLAQQAERALACKLISSMSFFGDFSSKVETKHRDSTFDQLSSVLPWFRKSLKGPIDRTNLPSILKTYDVFIHGFLGSLDKVLIEATLAKLPVATENPEYLKEFGVWPGCNKGTTVFQQLEAINNLPRKDLQAILTTRYNYALRHHSLESWMERVFYYLDNPKAKW